MIKSALLSMAIALQGAIPLDDPQDEARAQNLMREIRCVACENEPVSQSAAEIAGDMRVRIRVMVSEGQSDDEIRTWFVERYGEFVLFRPGSRSITGKLLWGLPFALLLFGGGFLLLRHRPQKTVDIDSIDPQDA
ncbi:MAG: cytochrome c-type biogenesis protein [Pseudomonadota bacterium]